MGGIVPCSSPREGVRTHPWAARDELQALGACSRHNQSPGAPGIRALGLGCPARGSRGVPSQPFPITPVLGQPRGSLVGRHKARRSALAGGMARIGFSSRGSRKHLDPSESPIQPYCGSARAPRCPTAVSGWKFFPHSLI